LIQSVATIEVDVRPKSEIQPIIIRVLVQIDVISRLRDWRA